MGIQYRSLDDSVRARMVEELELDTANGTLYISSRLTDAGAQAWPELLRDAFGEHDDAWLASQIRSQDLMRTHEQKRKPKGGFTMAAVPVTAPDTLAEGEFNRFYARGICADVVACGGESVQVYRGKAVEHPRSQSEAMLGSHVPAESLLEDLRTAQGVEPCLGLPPGPNSGLTVCRLGDT